MKHQQHLLEQKQIVVERLEQVDQLKDEFLANTSHELKTLLNGIIGIAESLIDGVTGDLPKGTLSNLALIASSGIQISNLVNDILDAALLKNKEIQLHKKSVDLHQMIQFVIGINTPLFQQKSLNIKNEVPVGMTTVFADEIRLQQILQNLLGNAIKFTDQGNIIFSALQIEKGVQVTVLDTGQGILSDQREAIFQTFKQLDQSDTKSHSGTGLGLSITKQLVELHGGNIWVESEEGRGSQFHIILPAGQQIHENESYTLGTVVEHEPLPTPLLPVENPLYQILVVDDDLTNLRAVQNHLLSRPYQVITASSGAEALKKVEEVKPDLILLDVMMPQMNGFDVCSQVRSVYSMHELPIIFLTAKNQITDLIQGFNLKGNDYLTKPFDKQELLLRIHTQLSLLTSRNCLIALRGFANQIARIQDSEKLIHQAYQFLSEDKYFSEIALFNENHFAKSSDEQNTHLEKIFQRYIQEFQKQQEPIYQINDEKHQYLFFQLKGVKAWTFLVQMPTFLSGMEKEYIKSIIFQAQQLQDNLKKMAMAPQLHKTIHSIAQKVKSLFFIQAANQYVELHGADGKKEMLSVSLKAVHLYLKDHLVQVHRSFLINPHQVQFARLKSKRYEVMFKDHSVPVGDSYLSSIRSNYPHWFS